MWVQANGPVPVHLYIVIRSERPDVLMPDRRPGRRRRRSRTKTTALLGTNSMSSASTCAAILGLCVIFNKSNGGGGNGNVNQASGFESFSSFTFGSVPGGEPRFSFGGFNPGGMGGGDAGGRGGEAVDNQGYYEVCPVFFILFRSKY